MRRQSARYRADGCRRFFGASELHIHTTGGDLQRYGDGIILRAHRTYHLNEANPRLAQVYVTLSIPLIFALVSSNLPLVGDSARSHHPHGLRYVSGITYLCSRCYFMYMRILCNSSSSSTEAAEAAACHHYPLLPLLPLDTIINRLRLVYGASSWFAM